MDEGSQGLCSQYGNAIWDWMQPWWRPSRVVDKRLTPIKGGGRRLRHPFLPHIVYPRVPDRTLNFAYDRLTRGRTVNVDTLTAMGTAKFTDPRDAVIIQEVWLANQLSTLTKFFHALRRYWVEVLPPGRYVGWQPRDLTWKNYFVEILDVQLGQPDEFHVEELGERPFIMREQLTLTFRTPKEYFHPAGSRVAVGF